LLDGAHNVAGAEVLRTAIGEIFPATKPTLILGVLGDKDWRAMCELLAPLASRVLLVPVSSERTAQPAQLAEVCRTANPAAEVVGCASLTDALAQSARDEFVVIAGSLYLIGEALAVLDPAFAGIGDERKLNEWFAAPTAKTN
jgi:dihydrofolate synthase/folylpolyglutamate synthase